MWTPPYVENQKDRIPLTLLQKNRRLRPIGLFNPSLADKVYNVSFCLMNSTIEDNVSHFRKNKRSFEKLQKIVDNRNQAGHDTANYTKPDCGLGKSPAVLLYATYSMLHLGQI